MSISEIVEELGSGVSKERVSMALTRGKGDLFVLISDSAGNNKKWGLKQI